MDGGQRAFEPEAGHRDAVAHRRARLDQRRRLGARSLPAVEPRGGRLHREPRLEARRPGVAGRDRRAAERALGELPLGLRRHLRRLLLQVLDDLIDLAPGVAEPLVQPVLGPAAQGLLALPQPLFTRLQARLRLAEHLALAGDEPPLVVEVVQVLVDLRQMLGQLRIPLAQVLTRLDEDRGAEADPAGDLERQAPARGPVDQAVAGRERLGIEAERRHRHARCGRRVRLDRVAVARADDHRPARLEVVDHGRGQRAPLARVGARAELVEQHQRWQRQHPVHADDVGDVPREGAQAGGNRLLVADVGEDAAEDRQPGSGRGRDVQSRLRHQRQQSGRFERHGLAAGVWPSDDEHAGRRRQQHIDRDRFGRTRIRARRGQSRRRPGLSRSLRRVRSLGGPFVLVDRCQPLRDRPNQQRMPGQSQFDAAVVRHHRLDAADHLREPRLGLHDIQLGGGFQRPLEIDRPAAERVGQREEDPMDLGGLLLFEGNDVVVDLDRAERLEKQAGAARRAAVDDAGNRGPVLGAHDEHVAAVAVGDDLVLQVAGGVAAAQVRLERCPQPRALLSQAVADGPELTARVVVDLAARIDLVADVSHFGLERRGRVHERREERVAARGPLDGGARLLERVEEISEPEEPQWLERAALHGQRGERRADVGRRLQWEEPAVGEVARPLGRRAERLRDAARIGLRPKPCEALATERGRGVTAHGLDDAIKLQGVLRSSLHIGVGGRFEGSRSTRRSASHIGRGNLLC